MNARNKALLKSNDYSENSSNDNYAFGNSLQVVYDDLRTLNLYGELKADFSENVIFGINGSFSSFTTDFATEAWNLPVVLLRTISNLICTINSLLFYYILSSKNSYSKLYFFMILSTYYKCFT